MTKVAPLALAATGCLLLLLGTFVPYVSYGSGSEGYDAVFDLDHGGNTWPYALSALVAVASVPVAAVAFRRRGAQFGAFLMGVGLVTFLDFLGAYVIAPTTYQSDFFEGADLRAGGILGTIGGMLLIAAGAIALRAPVAEAGSVGVKPSGDAVRRLPAGRRGVALLLAAIALNAVLGIVAILFGDFGDTNQLAFETLASSLCITGALLTGLGCVPALRRGSLRPIPLAGMCLAAIGFGLLFAGVWGQWSSTQFWKITASLVVAALGCAWASLVAVVHLPALHPLRILSLILVLAIDVATIAAIWALTDSGTFWRFYGVLALLATSTTLAAIVAAGSRASGRRTIAIPAAGGLAAE